MKFSSKTRKSPHPALPLAQSHGVRVRTNSRTCAAGSLSSKDTRPIREGPSRFRNGGKAPCRRLRLRSTPLSLAGRISPGSKSIRTCQRVAAPPCCEYTSNEHPGSAGQRHLFCLMLGFKKPTEHSHLRNSPRSIRSTQSSPADRPKYPSCQIKFPLVNYYIDQFPITQRSRAQPAEPCSPSWRKPSA